MTLYLSSDDGKVWSLLRSGKTRAIKRGMPKVEAMSMALDLRKPKEQVLAYDASTDVRERVA